MPLEPKVTVSWLPSGLDSARDPGDPIDGNPATLSTGVVGSKSAGSRCRLEVP